MIKVLASGSGKMGREVLAAVAREQGMQPVGCVDGLTRDEIISVPGYEVVPLGHEAAAMIKRLRPDVIVDFTNAAWTPQVSEAALQAGVRLVVGTTGLPPAFVEGLRKECAKRKLGAVVAPNFALGAVLMQFMARLAARHYSHAEIIEMHHAAKADAPSGTSIATARGMAEARGQPFISSPAEKETVRGTRGGEQNGIAIHSVRLPGLVAHQQVIFSSPGEILTIKHDTLDRESFMPGVVMAVREVMALDHLVYGLDSLMGLGQEQ
jgi:4-hydroxy-tetrahydrodipicolinate reductase